MKQAESFRVEMARLVKHASGVIDTTVANGIVTMTFEDKSVLDFTKPEVANEAAVGLGIPPVSAQSKHDQWLKTIICENCINKIWAAGDGSFGDPAS